MDCGPFGDKPMANSIHFKIEMISRRVYGDVYESGNTSFDWLRKPVSKNFRIMPSFPTRWSWPITSSSVLGRRMSARGRCSIVPILSLISIHARYYRTPIDPGGVFGGMTTGIT